MAAPQNPQQNPNQQKAEVALDADEQTLMRRKKLDELRGKGKAYPHNIKVSHKCADLIEAYSAVTDEAALRAAGEQISIAGRVSFIRAFGKAGFVKIKDRSGTLQIYVAKDKVNETSFEDYKTLDLGDIVRAQGHLFRTKTGELSLEVSQFEVLVKCLHAPPEKFHGLTDIEERYRKRYLDLFSNDDSRKIFQMRSRIVQEIRNYFLERDFLEVETPMMHPLVTGATARPFKTHHNTLDMTLFLRIAPELYLKRLVVGGMDRVFEMNRNFRNEGMSVRHNPEFTMLEFYMAYATYHDLMDMTEELIKGICQKLHGTTSIENQGRMIDLGKPWLRISMEKAVQTMSQYKGDTTDVASMRTYLKQHHVGMTGREGPGALLEMIFAQDVEKQLVQPTFVTEHPVEISPLARRADKQASSLDVTERFELFINGQEMANGFNELNDPDDQKSRFLSQLKEKEAGNVEATDYDADFIEALEYGLPPTAGEGIGIDRITMLLTNAASIRDVILFPQMRPQHAEAPVIKDVK